METIGHILRSLLNTPANESMKYDFKVPKKTHKYPQIPRTTLPMSIDKDIKQAVKKNHPAALLPIKHFIYIWTVDISTKDPEHLRMLAQESDVRKDFLNVICST